MLTPEFVVILVTASNLEEARKIAAVLLDKRKAACVNILPRVHSSFWWQGKIDKAEESLLVIKTTASATQAVIELVKANHSYTVPEIIALPIIGGNPDYLDWINREVLP
ncbi:MAG: divalent-cation tolerance protein CutA [Dehalococcoidia bacterium]|jgi:periplasmic divalent cation tolerance protein